ncbi:TerC family protein [bacterium]|nr:MAG: TerC family protein [bacterium]
MQETASVGTPALWAGFIVFVIAMLALDLGVFHKKAHEVRPKEALFWSVFWISLALLFNYCVYSMFGQEKGMEFLTGYVIEKALSVDNIFVFLMLFTYFNVPSTHQHRILFWGILGALLLRGIFIGAGAALVASFHWILYLFGVLLTVTGAKMLFSGDEPHDPEKNAVYRLFRKNVRCTPDFSGQDFIVRCGGKWSATPMLLVLVAVEASDVMFAVDSIPAVFAVTSDPFIVYTSNIFAILGLRALYFLLAGSIAKLRFLKLGLSMVLVFIGGKMLGAGVYKVPVSVSLSVVAALVGLSVAASLLYPAPEASAEAAEE